MPQCMMGAKDEFLLATTCFLMVIIVVILALILDVCVSKLKIFLIYFLNIEVSFKNICLKNLSIFYHDTYCDLFQSDLYDAFNAK